MIGNLIRRVGDAAKSFLDIRSDYSMAKRNTRFRRRRTGINPSGSGGDYHYQSEADYLWMIELARDMDRNDAIVGQLVDRAVSNIVQDGFVLEVETGDTGFDAELTDRWSRWSNDPLQCDRSGQLTFCDIENFAQRHTFVDGDVFVLPNSNGSLQVIEGHRVRTPYNTDDAIVNGVQLDAFRRRLAYYFTADDIAPTALLSRSDLFKRIPTFDEDGTPLVFHILNAKRVSQTRGVTAFAPVVDLVGMFDDINFAKLVQAQIVSCWAVMHEMDASVQPGAAASGQATSTTTGPGGETRTLAGMAPGMEYFGRPGEKLQGFSPNVPNPEFFQQARLILQLIGLNLGMPLVLVLLDGSETNFSGWRGAMDQAKIGFRRAQQNLKTRLHTPVFNWKVRQWAVEDRALGRAADRIDLATYGHRWNTPSWPYIEPMKDAQADAVRLDNRLISPRRLHGERGRDYEDVAAEIVEDNILMISLAAAGAQKLNAQFPEAKVDWREVASFKDSQTLALPASTPEPAVPGDLADE